MQEELSFQAIVEISSDCPVGVNKYTKTLQHWILISFFLEDDKISEINKLLLKTTNVNYFKCSEITDSDIKRLVDILPKLNLMQFIEGSLIADYIIIDYEDQDKIYYCYSEEECIDTLKAIKEGRSGAV